MSLTTQSESVPLVEATRFATGWPLILTGAVSTSDVNTATSVRPDDSRWSLTSHFCQPSAVASTGRGRYGTGRAGSETYSEYSWPPAAGAESDVFPPAAR